MKSQPRAAIGPVPSQSPRPAQPLVCSRSDVRCSPVPSRKVAPEPSLLRRGRAVTVERSIGGGCCCLSNRRERGVAWRGVAPGGGRQRAAVKWACGSLPPLKEREAAEILASVRLLTSVMDPRLCLRRRRRLRQGPRLACPHCRCPHPVRTLSLPKASTSKSEHIVLIKECLTN